MKVKAIKLEVLVMDFDNLGPEGVRNALENTRFANDCISPSVMAVESREVEWHDGHPLNHSGKALEAYRAMFAFGGEK